MKEDWEGTHLGHVMGDIWLHLEFLFTLPRNSIYTADRLLTSIPCFWKRSWFKILSYFSDFCF